MPDKAPQRPYQSGVGWGFGVLAAVIVLIVLSWGFGSNGRGWGESDRMAHMMPPAAGSSDGPATRAWRPGRL